MAAETIESPPNALSGVARVLVNAGKLSSKAGRRTAQVGSRPQDQLRGRAGRRAPCRRPTWRTRCPALALPLLDLNAVDLQKVPKNIVDQKTATQYQLLVLGKRGSRLFVATADPTDQEAAERIKFATQLSPRVGDRRARQARQAGRSQGTSANDARVHGAAATSSSTSPRKTPRRSRAARSRPRSKTRRWCASCRRC
jgi:type IV pilus assembly protein PilB